MTKSRFDSIEPAIIVAVYTTEISQEGVTMVDFEWYRSFICIFKHNSVSLAAKARIMTQPALSQHLAFLEAEVGELLFTVQRGNSFQLNEENNCIHFSRLISIC